MRDFWQWLGESRQNVVSPSILQAFERAFKEELQKLVRQTRDPILQAKFQDMLDCPIRDSRGKCRGFAEYVLSALLRNGIHHRYDVEAALSYVFEKMMLDRTETGEPRATVFGSFRELPGHAEGNPLQARFMKYLQFAVNDMVRGKIPRLANVERRPQGTVAIGQGRRGEGDSDRTIAADHVPARRSVDADLDEMIEDMASLLRKKELAYPIRLVDLFRSIMAGERTNQQVRRFGDRPTKLGRKIIIQTLRDYAESTGNYRLLSMLKRFEGFQSNRPMPPTLKPAKSVKPKLPEKVRDYASILDVIERLGRPVGTADLGKYRRRWLEYPPRDPSSGHRNRLEEVLERMVADGVLRAIPTRKGGLVYSTGPKYEAYRRELGALAQ